MNKYEFMIEFRGREIHFGEWEAVSLETARKEILKNLDLSIVDDNPSIFKVEKGGKNA